MFKVRVLPFQINFTHCAWEESCADHLSGCTHILKINQIFKIEGVLVLPDKKLYLSIGPSFDFFEHFCSDLLS